MSAPDPWQVIADVTCELTRGGQTDGIRRRAALQVLKGAGIDLSGKPVARPVRATPGPVAEIEFLGALAEAAAVQERGILEALCRRDGVPLDSAVEPGEAARNYELAIRLGIGDVYGLKPQPGEATGPRVAPELAAAMAETRLKNEGIAKIARSIPSGRLLSMETAEKLRTALLDLAGPQAATAAAETDTDTYTEETGLF